MYPKGGERREFGGGRRDVPRRGRAGWKPSTGTPPRMGVRHGFKAGAGRSSVCGRYACGRMSPPK